MKAFITTALLILIIGNIGAVDIESYQFIDHLRALPGPGKPEIYEDSVLFTVQSSYHRVGISFAHEGYSKVYWFKRLMIPKDHAELYVGGKLQKNIDPNRDSGIMFHLETIPASLTNMDYRIIIDGLWTTDPLNPITVKGPSGIAESRVSLPRRPEPQAAEATPGSYRFSYRAVPGEKVTVGGSFNNWDPFMYELEETIPGFYTLSLSLPPGRYQYVFFHRGEEIPDTLNARSLYTREGRIVSEAIVQ